MYLKPRFFKSLLILSDRPLLTGTFPSGWPLYRIVLPSEYAQR